MALAEVIGQEYIPYSPNRLCSFYGIGQLPPDLPFQSGARWATAKEEGQEELDNEEAEENLSNPSRRPCNPSKSENCRYERNNQEGESPTKHKVPFCFL
jgi:hypothetical protein